MSLHDNTLKALASVALALALAACQPSGAGRRPTGVLHDPRGCSTGYALSRQQPNRHYCTLKQGAKPKTGALYCGAGWVATVTRGSRTAGVRAYRCDRTRPRPPSTRPRPASGSTVAV